MVTIAEKFTCNSDLCFCYYRKTYTNENNRFNNSLVYEPYKFCIKASYDRASGTVSRRGYDHRAPRHIQYHTFVGWTDPVQDGQTYRCDHAFARYQIPVDAKKLPLVFVHGFGSDGVCWETTPDGRDGFATLLLREGYPTYVLDLPGRGHASRTSNEVTVNPVADEEFWFDIWRMGLWPEWNEGIQFPKDSLSVSNFFRQMVPDLSDHKLDVAALDAMAQKIGNHILVTHSAGGFPGWMAAMNNTEVKGVVALEPGGFVFPEGEVPPALHGLTGGLAGVPVPRG